LLRQAEKGGMSSKNGPKGGGFGRHSGAGRRNANLVLTDADISP
jgi:hypothetical protein